MGTSAMMQPGLKVVAGHLGGGGFAPGWTTNARFDNPQGIAVDTSGNLYVADEYNDVIRKVTAAGYVSVLAGNVNGGTADGTGTAAGFSWPLSIAYDGASSLYVVDSKNYTIRKVTTSGVVTTLAGSAGNSGAVNGTGTAAQFSQPTGITIDSSGNLYVLDGCAIRKIVISTKVVSTLAGSISTCGSTNATGTSASFFYPSGIVIDGASSNLYVADTFNQTIRKVTLPGAVVTTFAGTTGTSGSTDATGTSALFSGPSDMKFDSSGNLFVLDSGNSTIRKITAAGVVTTFAGQVGVITLSDGTASAAHFNGPGGIAIDTSNNMYVTDAQYLIRKVTSSAVVTTMAGQLTNAGVADGAGGAASFTGLSGIAVDAVGNIWLSDAQPFELGTIRKMTPAGVVTTLCGALTSDGSGTTLDGNSTTGNFGVPTGLVVNSSGTVFVADQSASAIRQVDASGNITTFVGSLDSSGTTNGTGTAAKFNNPRAIAMDPSGNMYVADSQNNVIRKVTTAGVVTTLAGTMGSAGSTNGTGTSAKFSFPSGIAIDPTGTILYVADMDNYLIRKIVISTAAVTTLAGSAGSFATVDGTGTAAKFYFPFALAVDPKSGVIFVGTGDGTVRRVTSAGVVTTFVGVKGAANMGVSPGHLPAQLNDISGVAVSNGILYILSEGAVLSVPER